MTQETYVGGELVFTIKKSPNYTSYYNTHNIKNKWLKFVGGIDTNEIF